MAKADPFSDIWKWVEDSPEIAVPALIVGAPLAIAAAPMIASYALFPVVSGVGYLLPEATMETIAGLGMETAVGAAALPPATVYRINSSFAVNSDTAPFGVSAE
jgi:hypothetical protein